MSCGLQSNGKAQRFWDRADSRCRCQSGQSGMAERIVNSWSGGLDLP
jgi:hypothetical protein